MLKEMNRNKVIFMDYLIEILGIEKQQEQWCVWWEQQGKNKQLTSLNTR